MTGDYNWDEIRLYYITHDISYKDLAVKYGVALNAVREHAATEEWVRKKTEAREQVAKEACEIVLSAQAERVAEQLNDAAEATNMLAKHLMEKLQDPNAFMHRQVILRDRYGETHAEDTISNEIDYRAMRDTAQAVRDLTQTIRGLYGIPTLPEKAAMELNKQKMALEEKKYEDSKEDEKPAEVIVRFENENPPVAE